MENPLDSPAYIEETIRPVDARADLDGRSGFADNRIAAAFEPEGFDSMPVSTKVNSYPQLKLVPLSLVTAARGPRHTARLAADPDGGDGGGMGGMGGTENAGGRAGQADKGSRSAGDEADVGVGAGADPAMQATSGKISDGGARADPELEGLARSLGTEADPRLAEPPVVEEMPDGTFRLCLGERRVAAARLAGWRKILCLVYLPMPPARAHMLSLVENMHRAAMHPLEEISALCISRLMANAAARGLEAEAQDLLRSAWSNGSANCAILLGLEQLLLQSGWEPSRPDVTWQAHLDDLGVSMAPWERKRKLRILNIEPDLQEQLQDLEITEAALRSLGTLEPGDRRKVVEALVANPALARKVRRVARARRDGFYASIEDALAEVQGSSGPDGGPAFEADDKVQPYTGHPLNAGAGETRSDPLRAGGLATEPEAPAPGEQSAGPDSPALQDAVLQILECADKLASAMSSLEECAQGAPLPEPWNTWRRDALDFITGLLPAGESTTGTATSHPREHRLNAAGNRSPAASRP